MKTSLCLSCFFSILIVSLVACKKLVTVDEPVNRLTSQVVFTTDKSAVSAVVGLYSRMMQTNLSFFSNAITIFPGLCADELNNTAAGSYDEFRKNSISPSNTVIQSNLWANAYSYIYHTNAILEGLDKSLELSPQVKKQLYGEALFLRSLCYFYLVNLFGDIPFLTATDFEQNGKLARKSSIEIYDRIKTDLNEAKSLLAEAYPSLGRTRPNKWTVAAFLARIYLYNQDYPNAEKEASAVINSGMYSLASNASTVFITGSSETIWQLAPVQPNNNTWEGNIFIPAANTIPQFTLESSLLTAFELGDQRKDAWIGSMTSGTTTYNYPFKYRVKTASNITENYIVFRLAELYLIRSEAKAKMQVNGEARNDLNLVRKRAGLLDIGLTTPDMLLAAIEQERRVELFAEWGHRWFDLKRTGRADLILKHKNDADWQATDTLYPIPFVEIQRNPSLIQNPGY